MDTLGAIVRFFQEGGIFMYPILIVFGLGLAIAIERWTYLTLSGASNRNLWKKIVPYLKAGNFQEAAQVTGKSATISTERAPWSSIDISPKAEPAAMVKSRPALPDANDTLRVTCPERMKNKASARSPSRHR